ncbi:protein KAKU4-like [Chenopodium quinoa]|uniref:Protein KAKU4 n=1 Tax=Chenopodium quinoa TaxID=63459 RepID=A0A803LYR1_CHEQI|nr:protein KAKU4-like [Chenopodium quinoa]
MATTSSRRTADGGGVGGKILKNRRVRSTPYSRPSPSPPPSDDPENPNWLSGLIYPAKVIASGAGKILSFFANDYSSSSSSSDGNSSDNDDEEEKIGNDISFQEDDRLDKVLSLSSKSDNKLAIEQLVTEETYSRKEANELIKLVRSRIVDSNGTFGETTPNMRTSAIMEARKWLQEKRSGSKKKFQMELDSANVASPFQISRSEKGSPVDMARSYMQNRPAWASPTLKQAEAGSSSPLGMLHFKEETPMSTLRSSEMKRSSFKSGSWNLLEEIRRVRSKATEELLAAAPLTKTILFSSESNLPQDSVLNKAVEEGAGPAESLHDKPENETSTLYRVSQEGEAIQSVEHQESQEAAELTQNDNDEVKQLKDTTAENGYGCSASGLAQGQDTANEARPSEGENGNLVDSSQAEHDIHMEDNLNPQEEPVIDIPTDAVVNGSPNSSSMQQEELSQNFSQPVAGDSPASIVKDTQKERKSRGYTRRGRGKGK